jgi:protoporphyrinogen oxidase
MSPSFCIVGGGVSSLLAAYRLRAAAEPAATVGVFDPADRFGGLRTGRIADLPLDIGAKVFVARRPEVPKLLAELGLSGLQIGTSASARPALYCRSRQRPMPSGTIQGIPAKSSSLAGLVDDNNTIVRIAGEAARPLHWQLGADPSVAELVIPPFTEVVTRSSTHCLAGLTRDPLPPSACDPQRQRPPRWTAGRPLSRAQSPRRCPRRSYIVGSTACPQYGPGHGDLVAELRARFPPRMAMAGTYLGGIGVRACVASVTSAAQSLVEVVLDPPTCTNVGESQ